MVAMRPNRAGALAEGSTDPEPLAADEAPKDLDEVADKKTSVILRRTVFTVVSIGLALLAMWSNDSPDVAAVLPFYFILITLQFLPMFWPADADAFAPPALPALLVAPEFIADVVRMLDTGTVEVNFFVGLTATTRVDLVQRVLVLWILSSLAYLGGYYLGAGRRRVASIFPNVKDVTWDRMRLGLASGVCFLAFAIAYVFFQSRVSTSVMDVTALSAGKAVWRDDPTLSWVGRGVLLGCIPLLFLVASVSAKPTLRRAVFAGVACLVMALAATRLGQRGYGFMFGLSCLIIIHNVYKRFKIGVLTLMGFVALISFNLMGEWRRGETEGQSGGQSPIVKRVLNPDEVLIAYASDRNRVSVVATVMYYIPDRQDYLYGDSYFALLFAPIPKWLWPEKQDVLKWRDAAIVGNLHGVPAPTPMHGVLYANFSWAGAVIGMFLWGLFQRGLYEWLTRHRKEKNHALLYSGMVLYLAPSSVALASVLQYVVPIYLIVKFAGRRVKASRAMLPNLSNARTVQ